MDTSENAKFGLERRTADHQGSSGFPLDWQFAMALPDASVVGIGPAAPMDTSPCPSVAMVESYSPGFWGHPPVPQNWGFTISSTANLASASKLTATSSTGMFLPDVPAALFSALPRFPADSALIERAARFSCFNGTDIRSVSSLGPTPSTAPYQQPRMDEGKQSVSAAVSNKACHAEGRNANVNSTEAAADDSSPSDIGAMKRKMVSQYIETEQAQQGTPSSLDTINGIPEVKVNKIGISSRKSCGKNSEDGPGDSKEDYVHVRARHGQATNSHSLAERVRREKISERMKYLQDLVPGCSKVTGKAVMLDEIINYVRSLQRQVEFLSMKLAAVSPRLECNIDNLIANNLLHSWCGAPSVAGFAGDMAHHPLLYPFQQGLLPAGVSGMVNPSDVFQKTMNSQLSTMSGYKDPTMQMQNHPWKEEESELHTTQPCNK